MIPAASILSLVEWAVSEEPTIEKALRNIFSKPEPTAADWQAERDAWQTPYERLVPNTKLPPPTPPTTPPAA